MMQKERQERSREEIYPAALNEFGSLGYENVSMERICRQHGISKGMIYHNYSNKDELFLLCVERVFTDLKDHIEWFFSESCINRRPKTSAKHGIPGCTGQPPIAYLCIVSRSSSIVSRFFSLNRYGAYGDIP